MITRTQEEFEKKYGAEAYSSFKNPTVRSTGDNIKDIGIGVAKGLGDTVHGTGNLLTEGGRYIQAGLDPTKTVEDYQAQAEASDLPWWANPFAGENQEMIEGKLKSDNNYQKGGKVLGFAGELLTPLAYAKGASLLNKGGKALGVADKVTDATKMLPTLGKGVDGLLQTGKEVAERVPRFVGKIGDDISEAGVRREAIRNADPVTRGAIKSGLDSRFINSIDEADDATRKAYLEVLDIADSPNPTLKQKARPEIVAGNTASDQYKLIEAERKNIGSQIGDAVGKLSTKGSVDVAQDQQMMRQVLEQNGMRVDRGGQLSFVGKYTNAERTKIQELYNLAVEGGDSLTPRQIRDMDNLFSKLQREARMDGVGDLFVSTPDGEMPLFRVFRDIYSNKLDEIAPEIKDLNSQYRNFVTLQDDIEKSIIKSGNFNTTSGVDPAEFAQTNLRRLFSEAQSSADYRAIYEEMDGMSRVLGYEGARADDLANFAYELRKLYPDTVPRTSAEGIWGKAWQVVSEGGQPDVVDQQRALRVLLEDRVK